MDWFCGVLCRRKVCIESRTKAYDPQGPTDLESAHPEPGDDQNLSISRAQSVAVIALTPSATTRS